MDLIEELKKIKKASRTILKDYANGVYFSTIYADDTKKFETAIFDDRYHPGWIIVEEYENEQNSIFGHKKWIDIFTNNPPEKVINISTSEFDILGFGTEFKRKVKS